MSNGYDYCADELIAQSMLDLHTIKNWGSGRMKFTHLIIQTCINLGSRFVHDDDVCSAHYGPRECDELLLTCTQRPRADIHIKNRWLFSARGEMKGRRQMTTLQDFEAFLWRILVQGIEVALEGPGKDWNILADDGLEITKLGCHSTPVLVALTTLVLRSSKPIFEMSIPSILLGS